MRCVSHRIITVAAVSLLAALAACRPRPVEPDPAPEPPPPEVPAGAAAVAAVSAEPELGAMQLATVSSKLGVPVDLRYQFDGKVEQGRPVILHLAAVPRVAGSNLRVSIKQEPGMEASAGAINVMKASATSAYRQQLSITRRAGGPRELRVLVTMDMPEGSGFGYYSVPFEPLAVAGKGERSEQR
jgi:hypothetical protein